MARIVIETNIADLIARLKRFRDAVPSIAGLASATFAREYAKTLRKHFETLDRTKSKYGHKFYIVEGKNRVKTLVEGNEAHVTVENYKSHNAMAHKLWGGVQRARKVGHLTLPISEKAKEAGSAKNFSDPLVAVKSKRGNTILIMKQGKKDFTVHYLLKDVVTHKPHPEVLPDANETAGVLQRGREDILRLLQSLTEGLVTVKT